MEKNFQGPSQQGDCILLSGWMTNCMTADIWVGGSPLRGLRNTEKTIFFYSHLYFL